MTTAVSKRPSRLNLASARFVKGSGIDSAALPTSKETPVTRWMDFSKHPETPITPTPAYGSMPPPHVPRVAPEDIDPSLMGPPDSYHSLATQLRSPPGGGVFEEDDLASVRSTAQTKLQDYAHGQISMPPPRASPMKHLVEDPYERSRTISPARVCPPSTAQQLSRNPSPTGSFEAQQERDLSDRYVLSPTESSDIVLRPINGPQAGGGPLPSPSESSGIVLRPINGLPQSGGGPLPSPSQLLEGQDCSTNQLGSLQDRLGAMRGTTSAADRLRLEAATALADMSPRTAYFESTGQVPEERPKRFWATSSQQPGQPQQEAQGVKLEAQAQTQHDPHMAAQQHLGPPHEINGGYYQEDRHFQQQYEPAPHSYRHGPPGLQNGSVNPFENHYQSSPYEPQQGRHTSPVQPIQHYQLDPAHTFANGERYYHADPAVNLIPHYAHRHDSPYDSDDYTPPRGIQSQRYDSPVYPTPASYVSPARHQLQRPFVGPPIHSSPQSHAYFAPREPQQQYAFSAVAQAVSDTIHPAAISGWRGRSPAVSPETPPRRVVPSDTFPYLAVQEQQLTPEGGLRPRAPAPVTPPRQRTRASPFTPKRERSPSPGPYRVTPGSFGGTPDPFGAPLLGTPLNALGSSPAPTPAPAKRKSNARRADTGPMLPDYGFAPLSGLTNLPITPADSVPGSVYPDYSGAIRLACPIVLDGTRVPKDLTAYMGFWIAGELYSWDSGAKPSYNVVRICAQCHTDKPGAKTWRRSHIQGGVTLCNKCGIYEHTHTKPRPRRAGDHTFSLDPEQRAAVSAYMATPRRNRAEGGGSAGASRRSSGGSGSRERSAGGGSGAGTSRGGSGGGGSVSGGAWPGGEWDALAQPVFGSPFKRRRKRDDGDADEWRP